MLGTRAGKDLKPDRFGIFGHGTFTPLPLPVGQSARKVNAYFELINYIAW